MLGKFVSQEAVRRYEQQWHSLYETCTHDLEEKVRMCIYMCLYGCILVYACVSVDVGVQSTGKYYYIVRTYHNQVLVYTRAAAMGTGIERL